MNRILKDQSIRKKPRKIKSRVRSSRKHKNSKHKNSKHKNSKHKNSKHKNSKHKNSKHKNSKDKNSKHKNSKHKNSKHKNSKHKNSKLSKRKKSVFGFTPETKSEKIFDKYGVIRIYGDNGCGACVNIKKLCDQLKIKYEFIIRGVENDEIIKNLKGIDEDDKYEGMYKYVPVILCKNGTFLGGSAKFFQIVNDI